MTMNIKAVRRLTNDTNHNAFTGACWFCDALYVAFRQGDAHVDLTGRLVVLRSRNDGKTFETVYVGRGAADTRDAHLYTDGQRLYLVGFVHPAGCGVGSGRAMTEDGLRWSEWTSFGGTDNFVMWRPEYHNGMHYCAGYDYSTSQYGVAWFQSPDGLQWERRQTIWDAATGDRANECYLAFKPTGAAALLMRREGHRPLLLHAMPPFSDWTAEELEVPISNPTVWWVDDTLWLGGRWGGTPRAAYLACFEMIAGKPELRVILPSGPYWDCCYMAVAKHPVQKGRYFFSYYSGHTGSHDPAADQWRQPDIYLADVLFGATYLDDWQVSELQTGVSLDQATVPSSDAPAAWPTVKCLPPEHHSAPGFVAISDIIAGQDGVAYLVKDIDVGPCENGLLYLGYDGPVRVWVNDQEVFRGPGSNPATADKTVVPVPFRHGTNRIVIALASNKGKACGIFARYEALTAV